MNKDLYYTELEVCMGRFFRPGSARTHFFFASPLEKSPFICQPGPLEKSPLNSGPGPDHWKNRLSFGGPLKNHGLSQAGLGMGLASGSGLCRPLPQPFVRSCSWKVKTMIPLFIANTFLHNWMTYVNVIQCKHFKMYFKFFSPIDHNILKFFRTSLYAKYLY